MPQRALRLVLGMLAAAALVPSHPAAHSWYPKRCCNEGDCFQADRVRRLSDGTLEIANGDLIVRITPTFPVEASPDGKTHFCVFDSGWGMEARCVFMPAGS